MVTRPTASVRIEVPREFKAWRRGFGTLPVDAAHQSKEAFDMALDLYFSTTQEAVHILSGDLKATGRIEYMDLAGPNLQGAVTYGDEDVVYAGLENDRGGDHAYMDIGWEAAQSMFDAVMPVTWAQVVRSWR